MEKAYEQNNCLYLEDTKMKEIDNPLIFNYEGENKMFKHEKQIL